MQSSPSISVQRIIAVREVAASTDDGSQLQWLNGRKPWFGPKKMKLGFSAAVQPSSRTPATNHPSAGRNEKARDLMIWATTHSRSEQEVSAANQIRAESVTPPRNRGKVPARSIQSLALASRANVAAWSREGGFEFAGFVVEECIVPHIPRFRRCENLRQAASIHCRNAARKTLGSNPMALRLRVSGSNFIDSDAKTALMTASAVCS
jgi:hypothetical protein